MRARQAYCLAIGLFLLIPTEGTAQDSSRPATTGSQPPARPEAPKAMPMATPAEANQARMGIGATRKALEAPEVKDLPSTKQIRELLAERERLLTAWETAAKDRSAAEKPEKTPEAEAAEFKAELAKSQGLLDEWAKAPDSLLPEAFQAGASANAARTSELRLVEMKEAIDAARVELKDRAADLETLRSTGTKSLGATIVSLRADRDKIHQSSATLVVGRADLESKVTSATSPQARELAQARLTNFDWECRVEAERLAAVEARIILATQRLDLVALQLQAKNARTQFVKRMVARMEDRYASLAEKQRSDLKTAGVKEEKRAATSGDPLERYRAKRTAELLDLESQVVAYEKDNATTGGLSLQDERSLADATEVNFAELRGLLDDGNVSPLDVLRLKNDFRRIVPERAQIIRSDLAAANLELTTYENALTDAEIDLVNDSRDDRFDRDTLLEQVPPARRAEAKTLSDEIETRHKALLNRRRAVLQKLARRSEDVHNQVLRRIDTLDKQYAFIRTHIFWIRDAEPLGPLTVAHARDDSIRTAKAVVHLAMESVDRPLWRHPSPEFILVLVVLAVAPWPMLIGLKALDRFRLANTAETALGLADFPTPGLDG